MLKVYGRKKVISQKYFLFDWINQKLKERTWEDWKISEKKYLVSFLPLLDGVYLKQTAKELGISYGVLRNYLSERKVKKLTKIHVEEFVKVFLNRIVEKYKRGEEYDELIKEAIRIFSEWLIANIIESVGKDKIPIFKTEEEALVPISPLIINLFDKIANVTKAERKKTYFITSMSSLTVRLSALRGYLKNVGDKEFIGSGKKKILPFMDHICEIAGDMLEEIGKVKRII